MRASALTLLAVLSAAAPSLAQTPSLDDTLRAARRPIVVRDGRLEGAAAGPGLRVVGTDQELMGASRMLLESIGTPDPAARRGR